MNAGASLSPPDDFPYPCTAAYGRDRYGIWQRVVVAGVAQVFRWIPPGLFTMGSPDEEVDRKGDELQREVSLTHGFWLADTACTQSLWVAVVGDNPSQFKGPERPVEWVSFDKVAGFLKEWNHRCPTFPVRLPREAEWEYACRAGTTTPFSFGETMTTRHANFDGDQPYHDTDVSELYRGETVMVKALPANAWGLYQMHGNVGEWCADRMGPYDPEQRVNPRGAAVGAARVVRGGAFWSRASDCRSACRGASYPGDGWRNQGFRLASGP